LEDLEYLIQDIPLEKIFVRGDLSGHVGSVSRSFKGLHDGMAYGRLM